MSEKIDWNDPNLDLDSILGKGYEDIDKKEGFIIENKNNIKNIIDLELRENFSDISYELYDGNELIGVIEYSIEKDSIHINFLGTINGDLKKVISDNEFNEKFISYFGNINSGKIRGIGKELLKKFILKFNRDTNITFVSLKGSEGFYDKVLEELEKEGLIIVIPKIVEYEFIVV